MPIERILVAVDLSEASRPALGAAVDLRDQCSAQLQVLYVWEAPAFDKDVLKEVAGADPESQLRTAYEEAGAALRRYLETADIADRERLDLIVEIGSPASTICKVAAAGGHDVIVIGTHGRRGITYAVTGSVAEKVIRAAPCPVLIVRARGQTG